MLNAITAWVLNNLNLKLDWHNSAELNPKTYHLDEDTRKCASNYKAAVEFCLNDSTFPQINPILPTPRKNAWQALSKTPSHEAQTIASESTRDHGQTSTSHDNATVSTSASSWYSMSPSITQDILNLQRNLRKLSFRTKIAKAETGATQLATFNAMNTFDRAIHAFEARMNRLESACTRQAQINSHTLQLILDPETSLHNGTVQTLSNLVTQESQSAREEQEWLDNAGLEDFTPPLPEGWHCHNQKLTCNKGH